MAHMSSPVGDRRLVQCPFCYGYSPRGSRRLVQCDDCLREYIPLKLEPRRTWRVADNCVQVCAARNGFIIPPRYGFAHESLRHPDLALLRAKYGLDRVVRNAAGEFEQQLLLRDWLCSAWTGDLPAVPMPWAKDGVATHVETMLTNARRKGYTYYCTFKAMAAVELASAMGWTARMINIMGHMLCEVWSNAWNKWYVSDGLYNTHYERGGVPLSAWEVREAFYRNGARGVRLVWGARRHDMGQASCGAFAWYVVYLHNNFFEFPPGDHIHPLLMPRDRHNRRGHWRQGPQILRRRGDKYLCKGMVQEESDPRYLDGLINQTTIFAFLRELQCLLRFQHNMPNFDHLAVRVNGGRWRRHSQWRRAEVPLAPELFRGGVRVEAHCVNLLGVAGPTSFVEMRSTSGV